MMQRFTRRTILRWGCRTLLPVITPLIIIVVTFHQLSYMELTIASQSMKMIDNCVLPATDRPEDSRGNNNSNIPNLIHQIWKTGDFHTYPSRPSHEAWANIFTKMDYSVKLWTDNDVMNLIETNYTWLASAYNGYSQNIQRADLARLVVLHAQGGIYADLDVHPISVTGIQCLQHLGSQALFSSTAGNSGFSNHFFMAKQGSPFLYQALHMAKERSGPVSKHILLPYLEVFWSTGPLMVTSAFRQYMKIHGTSEPEVVLLEENYAKSVIRHAAGRSWHGLDGRLLNALADHVRMKHLWISVLLVVIVFSLICFIKYRGHAPTRSLLP